MAHARAIRFKERLQNTESNTNSCIHHQREPVDHIKKDLQLYYEPCRAFDTVVSIHWDHYRNPGQIHGD